MEHDSVGGYTDKEGRVSIVQTGRKLKQYPFGMGVSIHSKIDAIPEPEVRAREILKRIGHRGFFEFEWKWDPRVSQWRFIEINLGPWATWRLARATAPGWCRRVWRMLVSRNLFAIQDRLTRRWSGWTISRWFCRQLRVIRVTHCAAAVALRMLIGIGAILERPSRTMPMQKLSYVIDVLDTPLAGIEPAY